MKKDIDEQIANDNIDKIQHKLLDFLKQEFTGEPDIYLIFAMANIIVAILEVSTKENDGTFEDAMHILTSVCEYSRIVMKASFE